MTSEPGQVRLSNVRLFSAGSVCARLCTVAVGLLELAHCSCQSANNVENILRIFVSFFTFLTNLSKYVS